MNHLCVLAVSAWEEQAELIKKKSTWMKIRVPFALYIQRCVLAVSAREEPSARTPLTGTGELIN